MAMLIIMALLAIGFLSYFAALLCEIGAGKTKYEPRKSRLRKAQKAFYWASVALIAAFIVGFACLVLQLAL